MSGFFVAPENVSEDTILISGSDVNHIKNVMRMKAGDVLNVSDGTGFTYACELLGFEEDGICLKILSREFSGSELKTKISLFQGLPKKDKMELIIQKAVELGVYEIYPVINERTIVKIDEKKIKSKVERWNKISEAAAKQSGRAIIPVIHEPIKFNKALTLATEKCNTVLIPYENADGMGYSDRCLDEAVHADSSAIFIGPEGGFSMEEVDLAKEANAKVISLGSRILRTETAGMTVLSIMMFKAEQLEAETLKE